MKSIRGANRKVQAWDKYIRKTLRPHAVEATPLTRYWAWVRRKNVRMHLWHRRQREYRRRKRMEDGAMVAKRP